MDYMFQTSGSSEPDHLCIAEYSVLDLRNKVIEDKVMFVNPRSEQCIKNILNI